MFKKIFCVSIVLFSSLSNFLMCMDDIQLTPQQRSLIQLVEQGDNDAISRDIEGLENVNFRIPPHLDSLLHVSIQRHPNNDLIFTTLLNSGCNPNIQNAYGRTPLHEVALRGVVSQNIINLLLRAPTINTSIQDHSGNTALHLVSQVQSQQTQNMSLMLPYFFPHINIKNHSEISLRGQLFESYRTYKQLCNNLFYKDPLPSLWKRGTASLFITLFINALLFSEDCGGWYQPSCRSTFSILYVGVCQFVTFMVIMECVYKSQSPKKWRR